MRKDRKQKEIFLKGVERKADLCEIGAIWKRLMNRKSYL